jgi:DNA adenine methylase
LFRYPGGKAKVAMQIVEKLEGMAKHGIVEPFCGGASVSMLFAKRNPSAKIVINDLNDRMFNFWIELVENYKELANSVFMYKPDVDSFFEMKTRNDALSSIVVNRCSHSGRGGGPIGGKDQSGRWKIDARWNARALSEEIELLGKTLSGRCHVTCRDGISMISEKDPEMVLYADPPYVSAGKSLYEKHFCLSDHERMCAALENSKKWVLSYDDHDFVRSSYDNMNGVYMEYVGVNAAKHSGGGQKQTEVMYIKP